MPPTCTSQITLFPSIFKVAALCFAFLFVSCEDDQNSSSRELDGIKTATPEPTSPAQNTDENSEDLSVDSDGDGVLDSDDLFPNDSSEWMDTDLDGTGDNADQDDDGDGLVDAYDPSPLDKENKEGEGINLSLDSDRDGLTNLEELVLGTDPANVDSDGDSLKDGLDLCPLDATSILPTTYYEDLDGDGFGDASKFIGNFCKGNMTYGVANNSDIDDADEREGADVDGDGVGIGLDFDDTKPHISIVDPMVMVFNVVWDRTVTLPLVAGYDYKFTVDWGDGTSAEITSYDDPDRTKIYDVDGQYTVTLDGLVERFDFSLATSSAFYLIAIPNLGAVGWLSMDTPFTNAKNLRWVAGGDVSHVQNFNNTFKGLPGIMVDTSTWDTSNATSMVGTFEGTRKANPDVSNFNMSKVTSTQYMFKNNWRANPDMLNWDVSSLKNAKEMFLNNISAEPDLSKWNLVSSDSFTLQHAFKGALGKQMQLPRQGNIPGWQILKDSNFNPDTSVMVYKGDDLTPNSEIPFGQLTVGFDTYNANRNIREVAMQIYYSPEQVQDETIKLYDIDSTFQNAIRAKPRFEIIGPKLKPKLKTMVEVFNGAYLANPDLSIFDYSYMDGTTYSRIHNTVQGSGLSAGNYSKFLRAVVDPVYGTTQDGKTPGVPLHALVCGPKGDFDATAAISNLTDTDVSPNSWSFGTYFVTTCADTDGDGIENRDDPDIDGDGVLNEADPDIDGDGITNIDERTLKGSSPFYHDTDFDGVPDGSDDLPANPYDQVDGDGDGIGANFDSNDSSVDTMPFISIWRTTTDGETITLPIVSDPALSIDVDWGDSSSTTITQANLAAEQTHTYAVAGEYTVTITGTLPRFAFNDGGDKDKLIAVPYLGDVGYTSMLQAFKGCSNLEFVGHGDLSGVQDFNEMFWTTPKLEHIESGAWDVSSATTMRFMFGQARVAKPHTTNWNTSNVSDLHWAFYATHNADADLSNWDVSNVTNMERTFHFARWNPDVSNWNTSNVGKFLQTFQNAFYADPNVSNWDTSNATTMKQMFEYTYSASPDLSNWNTSKLQNLEYMFRGNYADNLDLSSWDVRNVTSLVNAFRDTWAVNINLSGWNLANVASTENMFLNAKMAIPNTSGWQTPNLANARQMFKNAFYADPDVTSWDTSKVTDIRQMFWLAKKANPDVSGWNTSNLVNMDQAFSEAFSANPDLSNWDFSALNTSINQRNNFYAMDIINFSKYVKAVAATSPTLAINGSNWKSYCVSPPALDASAAIATLGWSPMGIGVFCKDDDGDGVEFWQDEDDGNPSVGLKQ